MLARTLNIFFFIQIIFLGRICWSQDAPVRVACIGNSITYGYTLSNPTLDSYPAQLKNLLGSDYDVKNFGVSSRTMLKKGDYPYWNEPEFDQALHLIPILSSFYLGEMIPSLITGNIKLILFLIILP